MKNLEKVQMLEKAKLFDTILIHILKKTPNAGDKSKDHASFKKFEDKNRTAADGAQNAENFRLRDKI